MRLAIFDDLPEGGAKRVVFEQLKGLSEHHQVIYITNTIVSRFPFENYAHDIYRFNLDLWPLKGIMRPLQEVSYYPTYWRTYQKIAALLSELGIQAIIIHPSKLSQCPSLTRYVKIPTVYYAHEWQRLTYEPEKHPLPSGFSGLYENYRRKWLQAIDYEAVKAASKICSNSLYTAKRMEWAYNRAVTPLLPSVDADAFSPPAVRDDKYFLFIGEKSDLNGYNLLPKTAMMPIKYIRFNKSNSFRYGDKQLLSLYQHAYATLCLGRNEPFGLVPLESMAAGTPVIALAEGGYAETVLHRQTGYLISPCKHQLKDAMEQILTNERKRHQMGRRGRLHVVKNFPWHNHIEQLEVIINEVTND